MNDEERRTAKGWNDPPLYTFDQINKANQNATSHSAHPLHRKYKYPSAESQIQSSVPQNVGYPQMNAYGVQQPQQTNVYSMNVSQQPMYAQNVQPSFGQPQQIPAQGATSYQTQWNPPQQPSGNYGVSPPGVPPPMVQQQAIPFQQQMQAPFTGLPQQQQPQSYVQQQPPPTQYSKSGPVW